MQNQFTAVYQRCGEWWAARVEELPGANTQGATLEQARENLREAVLMILETNREMAEHDLVGADGVREELMVTSAGSGETSSAISRRTVAGFSARAVVTRFT